MYKFKNEIHEFQTFVKEHLNMFKLRLIKEQLYVNTGNYIDMLCINENNEYVIVELKLNAKVKMTWQPIHYYNIFEKIKINNPKVYIIANTIDDDLIHNIKHINDIYIKLFTLNINLNNEVIMEQIYCNNVQLEFSKIYDEIENKINWDFNYYSQMVNNQKIDLAKNIVNYFKIKNCKIYFYEKKIIIMYNNKVICTINILKDKLSEYIDFDINTSNLSINDIKFIPSIIKFSFGDKKIKIKCNNVPINLFNKYWEYVK